MSKKKTKIVKIKSNKAQNKYFYLLAFLAVSNYIISKTYSVETIGGNSGHFIYIILLPTLLGIIALYFIKKKYIKETLSQAKSNFESVGLFILYFIQSALFSYLTIGLIFSISYTTLTKNKISNETSEFIKCPIIKIFDRTSPAKVGSKASLAFLFNNKYNIMTINYDTYLTYSKSEPNSLILSLNIKKGLWDEYVIQDWEILKK